jgi:hypothetical protein
MVGRRPGLRPSEDSGWKGAQGLRKRWWPRVWMEIALCSGGGLCYCYLEDGLFGVGLATAGGFRVGC